MDLSKLSLVELKALAYDELAKMEQTRRNLDVVNQTIAQRLAAATTSPVPPANTGDGHVSDP